MLLGPPKDDWIARYSKLLEVKSKSKQVLKELPSIIEPQEVLSTHAEDGSDE